MVHKEHKQTILLEEQTILSRERTMQTYMSTGLAFIGVGLVVMRFFTEEIYIFIGTVLILTGFWQIYQAYSRFLKYRQIVRKIRREEKKLGYEIGED